MREIFISCHKRALYGSLLVCAMLALLLTTVLPCSVGGAEGRDEHYPDSASASDLLEELGGSRPYYSLEVAASFDPEAESLRERVAYRVPAELLPESLLAEGEGGPKAEGGDFSAAGAGGWTPLTRPYTPSPDPNIRYWASSFGQTMDNSGRLHVDYEMGVQTDITQAPDPGPTYEWLYDDYYSMFSGGSWTTPIDLTATTGFEDTELVFRDADSTGYLHIVYSKWTWGIDPTTVTYQHEQENLWYRYMSPDGTWSPPLQLTNFTGSWGLLGAEFTMKNGRLYGTFVTIRNNETFPTPSYRTQVGYLEGSLDTWEPIVQLAAWNYTNAAGQQQPSFWPSIDVSDLGGEVTVIYGVQTVPGAPYTGKSDIYGAVRGLDGTWSGPQNITNSPNNQEWLPIFVFYRGNANSATVFTVQFVQVQDAGHPPRNDVYLIYHAGGAWQAPSNVTHVAAQQDGTFVNITLGPLGNLHFCYGVNRYMWTGGPQWQAQGGELKFTSETGAGLSTPATFLGYIFQRYPADHRLIIDRDGNARVLFTTVMYDGVSFWNWNVNYIDNAPGGDPLVFNAVEQIRPNTNYEIYELSMSCYPDGDVLASWFEKGFVAGTPIWGRMFSRYRDGTTWQGTVPVSVVPGNPDILHVIPAGWPSFEYVEIADTGEQQCVFETAKYNPGPGVYYDFRKYFTETVNGVWTVPELVSSAAISGEGPCLYADGGQRYYILYNTDVTTNKNILYGTQQSLPVPPASTYFFAEGTTRPGFDEWLCIQNAGDGDANVTITYMLETGANMDQNIVVPAHTRSTVNVNAAVAGEHDISARVTADRFIVAERPMYFDYHGCTGGHCVMGALGTSRIWYFAEGTTRGGFDEYLTLQNPSEMATHVDITYVLGDGTTVPGGIDIGARSRATVNVNEVVGAGRDVSLVVESGTAIVAERPMYFNYYGITGGHCEMGSTSLATRWYFAEGTTRGGFDTYICLQNPYNVDAVADLTFILGDGSTVAQPFLVPATSRQTLRINDAVGPGQDVSTVVESDSLLLAERPMYFLYNGAWPGGHVVTGVREPKNTWFFAEGTTRGGFDEWLCLENPGDVDAVATMSFMLEDGTVMPADVAVPAHTRVTVGIWPIVGGGHDVSVAVSSSRAIVVERPMYFVYDESRPGGHVVVGL